MKSQRAFYIEEERMWFGNVIIIRSNSGRDKRLDFRRELLNATPRLSNNMMTHPGLSSLALIVSIVLCSGLAHAQHNNSAGENAKTTDALLRARAFNLLESLAGQINTLQSGENRARLGSNIAESLWKHDEKRARTLFVSVEDDIRAGLHNRESDDPRAEQ